MESEMPLKTGDNQMPVDEYENVFRRRYQENPKEKMLAMHRLWMAALQHEYPMPYVPYRIGVYIRFYNQTQYRDEEYLKRHKQIFAEDIALCPKWSLVDYYVDYGARAPHMESSKEWCRLLDDCFAGRVNLIVTQKASNISDEPQELTFISRILAAQKPSIGIYFVSEDIFTLASYYRRDITDRNMLPDGWKVLPPDELDAPMLRGSIKELPGSDDNDTGETMQEGKHAGFDQ